MKENDAMSLTVFANFRIDTEERFQRMKDSFESFRFASIDRWVINVRGGFREEVLRFLYERLGEKLIPFALESGKGWFQDSRQMLVSIESEYVFFWIEDHICMCGTDRLNDIIKDMRNSKIEYLGYSWFGLGEFMREFEQIPAEESEALIGIDYGKEVNKLRQQNALRVIGEKSYIISACGIFSRELFERILMNKRPLLRRWPKETPFDFEKRWDDEYILPIRYGVPKFEIFAAIDDDNKHFGSSLFSRGLYPERVSRSELQAMGEGDSVEKRFKWLRSFLKNIPLVQYIFKIWNRLTYHF